jgi:colicin import membrane protein
MSRIYKKCFIASVGMHLLLVVVLFICPAFGSKKQELPQQALDFVPSRTVDSLLSGGGTPNVQPPPAPLAPPTPAPVPEAPASVKQPDPPPPAKSEPKKEEPEPIKPIKNEPAIIPQKKEAAKSKAAPTDTAKKSEKTKTTSPEKTQSKVSLKPVVRKNEDAKRAAEEAEARERAEKQERAAAKARLQAMAGISGSLTKLRNNLSSPISIEPVGPGGGGESYANYGLVVVTVYENAWIKPENISDEITIVQASVTISRDGTVLRTEITHKSGNSAVDKSVQDTLKRVRRIAPFPDGSKDVEREFNISFNLKPKRSLG